MRTFFHSIEWRDILVEQFGYQPVYFTVGNAFLPNFILKFNFWRALVSMPASDYGGPVANDVEGCRALYQALINYSKRNEIAYIKMCLMDQLHINFFKPLAVSVELTKGVMEINLASKGSKHIANNVFSARTRKDIRQLDRSCFQAYTAHSESELAGFYNTYASNTREHYANVPYPYSFLKRMWYHLYPDKMQLWLIGKDKCVGGLLVLKDDDASYSFLFGVDRMNAPKFSIMQYLAWKEIVEAENEGIKTLSLGSTPADPNEKHHRVKKGIGATFQQQETVWIPMSSRGQAILVMRRRSEELWRKNRDILHRKARWILETRLGKL